MEVNEVTRAVIGTAMKVHSALGPGLLESAYEACLAYELREAGFDVQVQLGLPIIYRGTRIDLGYHELHLKDGIKRFVNRTLNTSESSVSSVVKTGLEG